jgi:hypothetical protein
VFERNKTGDIAALELAMRAIVSDLTKFAKDDEKKEKAATTVKSIIHAVGGD